MKNIQASELITNTNGSIYHLDLLPGQVSSKIILVGDPERVAVVSAFFDAIEVKKSKREFVTHTGYYKGERLTVISTGIGTDNVEIVINELDALFNIDFSQKTIIQEKQSLAFLRLGTSGSIQENIPINSVVASSHGYGFDGLLNFYEPHAAIKQETIDQFSYYKSAAQHSLLKHFSGMSTSGKTATLPGFYAPQGRHIRLRSRHDIHSSLEKLNIANLEMETAGIYGLCHLLDHKALSLSAILANRKRGTFSKQPKKIVQEMIAQALELYVDF